MLRSIFMAGLLGALVPVSAGAVTSGTALQTLFANLDTNHDGIITAAEAQAPVAARFAAKDLNHDGYITADEVQLGAKYISIYDTDGDGQISQREYLAKALARFDAWDADHNGSLSPAEQAAAVAAMPALPPH